MEMFMKAIEQLDFLSLPSTLFEPGIEQSLRCLACAHRCLLSPGKRGICGVRFNRQGSLMVPHGYVAGLQVDPIEKKPFNHFLPGSEVLTFGMLGCNFHCAFCQNWFSSQAGKDQCSDDAIHTVRRISPERVIQHAIDQGAQTIASSYNEPLITTEWAVEIFKQAKMNGLKTLYVSNGFATPQVMEHFCPWLDGYKVDLKSMQESEYRKMGGRLQPVLDTIPGLNDSSEELWDTGRFLASISPDIPWHVTAYHPDYKYVDAPPTPSSTLLRAAEIGQEAGLRHVYAGNLPGKVGSLEDTHCPNCAKRLIARHGYRLTEYHITSSGECAFCSKPIPGVWGDDPLKSGSGGTATPYPVA